MDWTSQPPSQPSITLPYFFSVDFSYVLLLSIFILINSTVYFMHAPIKADDLYARNIRKTADITCTNFAQSSSWCMTLHSECISNNRMPNQITWLHDPLRHLPSAAFLACQIKIKTNSHLLLRHFTVTLSKTLLVSSTLLIFMNAEY